MVKAGYAWHYKKYQKEQSEDDRLSYRVAENNARIHKLGLFQDNNSVPPWKWRKLKRKNNLSRLVSGLSFDNLLNHSIRDARD